MKRMIVLSFVALAVVALAGCQKPPQPEPQTPVAPPAPSVTEISPESSGPTTIMPESPRSPSARTAVPQPTPSAAPSAGGGKTYTVQAGDNLYRISVKFYGNASKVREIMDLNGIKDEHKVPVGMVLKLP